jgi:hypothetical protein
MSDPLKAYLDHMAEGLGLMEALATQIAGVGPAAIVTCVDDGGAPFVRLISPEEFYAPAEGTEAAPTPR